MNSSEKVADDIAEWKKQGIEKTELMSLAAEDMLGWPYGWGATGQTCTVANRKRLMSSAKIAPGDINLLKKRCQVLNGSKPSCDGCKYYPDCKFTRMRDCIAFVNYLLEVAGIPHYGAGCTTMWRHEANWKQKGLLSDMPNVPCLVFQRQSKQEPNRMQHIGYYDGNGNVYHCSVEVKKQKLSDYPWTNYAIPYGMDGDVPVSHKTIKKGSVGPDVILCQQWLMQLGYDVGTTGADGKFGKKTEEAVKTFQSTHKDESGTALKVDGIVGRGTWWALQNAIEPGPGPEPTPALYTVTITELTREDVEKLVSICPVGPIYEIKMPHMTAEQVNAIKSQFPAATATEEKG